MTNETAEQRERRRCYEDHLVIEWRGPGRVLNAYCREFALMIISTDSTRHLLYIWVSGRLEGGCDFGEEYRTVEAAKDAALEFLRGI